MSARPLGMATTAPRSVKKINLPSYTVSLSRQGMERASCSNVEATVRRGRLGAGVIAVVRRRERRR